MKFTFNMHKVSWIILIGFVAFLILDLISTLSVGPLLPYMEANPTYIFFGWPGMIAVNIIGLYILLKMYDSAGPFNRYMVIASFVYLCYIRVVVSISNFSLGDKVQSGEITKQMVQSISNEAKMSQYFSTVTIGIFAPIIFNLIIYLLFKLDHKIEVKKNGKNKKT